MAISNSKKMKIYLHVAIPSSKENHALPTSLKKRVKRVMRTALDWLAWGINKTFLFKCYNYTQRAYCNRGDIAIKLAIKELLQKGLHDVELDFVETEWGCLNKEILADINQNAAIFVIAGGGYWVFSKTKKLSRAFLADSPFFPKISCPIAVFGSGVNFNMPSADAVLNVHLDAELQKVFMEFDQRVNFLAVRDQLTVDFFRSLGMKKTTLLCDPAVFLEPAAMQARPSGTPISIGINLAFHGPFAAQIFKKNILFYIEFLKSVQKKFHAKFMYFVHSDEELLIVQLLRFSGIKLEVVDQPAAELTGAYAQLDVLLCQMMHSNILSFNVGVPALNIAYDSKNFGFNQLIGMEDYCVSAHNLDAQVLLEKMSDLIANRAALALKLASKKKELSFPMEAFLHEVRELALSPQSVEIESPLPSLCVKSG
ncbi:polysaccharide pyruvyl transferase family protein [Solimicrobium silvestre]|uniref:Polysaccharide pyruvyl transferase n=1 Tax=Solimicrobium silvestre TaxID=2099400 RepID=A0A2S9GTC8_9BURK|nr:polysaccharide pyruvyl transferase family protein [Solimicrobium silvestre]PRC90956.1 Polysaccharide pyruvyl transferase [Solimicrobium silvestre]